MGCVTSKKDINDIHPHIFQVENVNDAGIVLSSGRLEVNESELILHQRDHSPIRWPLKSLRRYGYEKEYFSFEAGRRCQTGSGVFGFNCKRAQRLFNFVQTYVQIGGELVGDGTQLGSTPVLQVEPCYLEPRSDSTVSSGHGETVNTRRGLGDRRLSLRNSSRLNSVTSSNGCTSPSTPNYINDDPFMHPLSEETSGDFDVTARAPELPANPDYENIFVLDNRAYMNVEFGRPGSDGGWSSGDVSEKPPLPLRRMSVEPNSIGRLPPRAPNQPVISTLEALQKSSSEISLSEHIYANVDFGDITLSPVHTPPYIPYTKQVDYAILDLDDKSQIYVTPVSPSEVRESYVTIDFNRTVALSQSASSSLVLEGVRKTRHDSSVTTDMITPSSSRHSACLSE